MSKVMRAVLTGLTVSVALVFLAPLSQAGAQEGDPYVGPASTVQGAVTELPPEEAPLVGASSPAAVASAQESSEVEGAALAFTGGDVAVLVAVALAAIAIGAVALAGRRSATAS
jgi:type IV secretory pathway VirB2 component (pilin)